MGSSGGPVAKPGSRTHPSSYPTPQSSCCCSRRTPTHSSLHRGRRLHLGTGNAPDQRYPTADSIVSSIPYHSCIDIVPYLHGDLLVVDDDLPCQKVGANGGLVARAELLVDLFGEAESVIRSSVGIGGRAPHILVHQACLADTAVTKNDDLYPSVADRFPSSAIVPHLEKDLLPGRHAGQRVFCSQ